MWILAKNSDDHSKLENENNYQNHCLPIGFVFLRGTGADIVSGYTQKLG